jgi:hypothetical protein
MNDEARFEAWKRARSAGAVPEGFAERVMASLPRREETGRRSGALLFLTGSLPGRVAVTLLATTVFLYRAACAFGIFFTE